MQINFSGATYPEDSGIPVFELCTDDGTWADLKALLLIELGDRDQQLEADWALNFLEHENLLDCQAK